MSNLLNKAKVKVEQALNKDKGDNVESSNYGPHSSNVGNKTDPRIDSDMDHRNNPTSTYGDTTSGGAYTGTTTTGGGYDNPQSTNAGPHSSNLANKMDPRVDSDMDNRNDPTSRVGGYGQQQGYGGSGANPMPGSGNTATGGAYTGSSTAGAYDNTNTGAYNNPTTGGGYDNSRSTNVGPHSSNLANKLDPRVDSDMDNRNDPTSRVGGYGTQDNYGVSGSNPTTGSSGYGAQTTGYGDQTTGIAGQTSGYGGQTTGGLSGVSATSGGYDNSRSSNLGPHSSNLANKMDPRVDSDGDNRNNPTSRVGGYGAQDNYGSTGANPNISSNYGGNTGGFDNTTGGTYGGNTGGLGNTTGGNFGGNTGGLDNTTGGTYGGNTGRLDNTTGGNFGGNTGGFDNTQSVHHSTTTGGNYGDNYGSSATPGSGNAPNTAGPHNSNLLNKLDPRVDSDMDGSKTYGGNQTNA